MGLGQGSQHPDIYRYLGPGKGVHWVHETVPKWLPCCAKNGRKKLCRKWPQNRGPLISLLNSLRKYHGSVLCGHFRHNFLRPFLARHGNHLGTISWTQWTPSPLPCPPFPFPLARLSLRPLWISLPQSSSLLPTTGLGSYSEWQHASSSVQGSSVRPKERSSGFDNSGESNRALQCQLLCVSRRKNKHNAKSLDRKKF